MRLATAVAGPTERERIRGCDDLLSYKEAKGSWAGLKHLLTIHGLPYIDVVWKRVQFVVGLWSSINACSRALRSIMLHHEKRIQASFVTRRKFEIHGMSRSLVLPSVPWIHVVARPGKIIEILRLVWTSLYFCRLTPLHAPVPYTLFGDWDNAVVVRGIKAALQIANFIWQQFRYLTLSGEACVACTFSISLGTRSRRGIGIEIIARYPLPIQYNLWVKV